jgi:predicted AlkP superfamily phosphohydrolase/phosphomutase
VKGREPQGVVEPADFEKVRAQLAQELAAIPGPDGQPLGTRVLVPSETYAACNGVAPDLMVYFGDLAWRSLGTIGHGRHAVLENDGGPDGANHHPDGIFVMAGPGTPGTPGGRIEGLRIYDVAPTVLRLLGQDIPVDMLGRVVAE